MRAPTLFSLALLLLAGCATPKPSETPTEKPAPTTSDLGAAWAGETEEPVKAIKLEQPPEPVDERAAFRSAMGDEAKVADAVALAKELTGVERNAAHARAYAQAKGEEAVAAAQAWYQACGPQDLEPCRLSAAKAWAREEKDAPVLKREQCLQRAERSHHKADSCLEKDIGGGDAVTRARVALVKAQAESPLTAKVKALERVSRSCADPRTAFIKRSALKQLGQAAMSEGDLERATKYALQETQVLWASSLPSERRWARTERVDELCAKYDAKTGAGACRKLERQVNKELSYRDYSKGSAGQGLDAETVKEVNAHYAPLLEGCLMEQARRMRPPDIARFNVRWTVLNNGRVTAMELPKEGAAHPLAQCLKQQFVDWRYPKYEGEYQHIEQSFVVSAIRR